MTALDIARDVFPDVGDDFLEFVLWEETGYPGFYAPAEGETDEDYLRRQLLDFKARCGI